MHKSLARKAQQGFTLIELVVVIVILGILAATALPRFVNMSQTARIASLNGMVGALNSAVSVSHAQFLVTSPAASPITMDGATVAVWGGYPDALSIGTALSSYSGFTFTAGSGAASTAVATFTLQTNCYVTYTSAAAASTTATATAIPLVATVTTGC